MIGFLKGKLVFKDDPFVYVEVGGIGYKVLVSKEVLALEDNLDFTLFTYTHVREDALELFGFLRLEDLKLFQKLINVSGIGPKTAINIFSAGSYNDILKAINTNDVDFFVSVPRLGKKNAQKIIIELRSRLLKDEELNINTLEKNSNDDIFSAFKSMGFTAREITDALQNARADNKLPLEEKIKLILKYLGK